MKKVLSVYLYPAGMNLIAPDIPVHDWTLNWPQHPVEVFRPRPEITEFGGYLTFEVRDFHTFVAPEIIVPHIEHVWLRWRRQTGWNDPYFAHLYQIGEIHAPQFDPSRSSYLGGTSVLLESISVLDKDGTDVEYKYLDLDIVAPTQDAATSWLKLVQDVRHPSELPSEFKYMGDWHDRLNRMFKKT